MKLLQSVLYLALCVFITSVLPKIKPRLLEKSLAYKGQAACNYKYQNQLQNITKETSIQTAECVFKANATLNQTNEQVASQINIARANLITLQANLSNCSTLSNNFGFVLCVNNNYNANMNSLNNAFLITQNVQSQINVSQQTTMGTKENCVNNVLASTMKNFTTATQEYNQCMSDIFRSLNIDGKTDDIRTLSV